MIRAPGLAALLLAAVCFTSGRTAPAEEPLRFRRVFVPQEELDREIRGLLPLKRDEFERRILQATPTASPENLAELTRIERAAYNARVEGDRLIQGTAELEIHHAAAGPTFMPLGSCNLALGDSHWRATPMRPAVLGHDQTGAPGCLVDRRGTLQWTWSLKGVEHLDGSVAFAIQVPPATASSLTLELPADRRLSAQGGIVAKIIAAPTATTEAKPSQLARQLWLVQLGGNGRTLLRVESVDDAAQSPPLVTVRESSAYSVMRSSLDLESSFEVDRYQQALPRLTLRVERPLEIASIRSGDRRLEWFVAETNQQAAMVVVDLPDLPLGDTLSLQVQATGLWAADSPATLPRIAVTEAVFQEGRATIAAPAWLQLQAKPLAGCWQSAVVPTASDRASDQLQFRLHEANAAIEIAADLAPAGLREASGTQFVIDASQISAVMTVELTSVGGDRFFAEARIPRRWIVDAVEVQPAEALSDRNLIAATPTQQLLRLNLHHALHESQPLRVLIRAHHRRPPNDQPLDEDFFRLAAFADVRQSRRLVAIRTLEPGAQLQLVGEEPLTRLDPAQLPEGEMRLFESLPGTVLFADQTDAAGMSATLRTAAPVFRAETSLTAFVSERQINQVLTVRCLPESSQVGQFVVRLSPQPDGAISWKLAGEDARELAVQYLEAATPGGSDDANDSAYRIVLSRPRSTAFAIQAEWTTPSTGRTSLSLGSVSEATAQTGSLEVRSLDGSPLVVDSSGVQSLPVSNTESAHFSTLRGQYSYQPGRRASLSIVSKGLQQVPAAAWVESLQVESRFSIDGTGQHDVTLQIVNQGLSQLNLRLPFSAMDVRQVDATGDAAVPLARNSSGLVAIALPAQQRRVTIRLRYLSDRTPLGWLPWGRFEAPLPEPSVPTLSRKWNVAVSPGLRARGVAEANLPTPQRLAQTWSTVRRDPHAPSLIAAFRGPALFSPEATEVALQADQESEVGLTGWPRYDLEFTPGPTASIQVYRPNVIQGLAIAWFLLAATSTWRFAAQASHWILPGAAALLALPIFAPAEWMPLTAALGLGVLAGGLGSLPTRRAAATRRERSTVAARLRLVVLGGAAALLAGSLWTVVLADDGPVPLGAPRMGPPPDHRVVIAMDDKQQPAGDYVFLSPEFYERLLKLAETGPAALPDWLLVASRFQLPPTPRLEGAAPSIDEIGIRFDLETFRDDIVVELPFRREQVLLLEARTRLDGAAVAVSWRDDGEALLIPVAKVGKHRLDLAIGAPAARTADTVVLDLTIPPVGQSIVTMPQSPASQPTIVSATGAELPSLSPEFRQTALGPANRLVVHWPLPGQAGTKAKVDVDQLLWWNLRPGSVVLEGKFRFRPTSGGAVELVQFDVDPRLRLVPGSISPAPANLKIEEGTRHNVRIQLAQKSDEELTLSATWLWVGASGSGNLALPQVAVQGDSVHRSWTAVSVDAALALAPQDWAAHAGAATPQVTQDDFLIAWSEPEFLPDIAFEDLRNSVPRSITVLPKSAQPSATTSARWSLDAERAHVVFSAQLNDVSPVRFQHVLDLPPALKASSIALTAGTEPIAHRWTQRPDGSVVITMLAAPPPQQLLVVEANTGLVRNRPRFPLPLVQFQEVKVADRQLQIFRHPDVQVQLQSAPGWDQSREPELGRNVEGAGRLVATLHREGDATATQPVLTVRPNRPQVSGRLAMRIIGDQGEWTAEADIELEITGGVLDLLRLEVPAEWSGPFTITPAVEHRLVPLPGGSTSHLLIWPQQAIGDKLTLTIQAPVRSVTGQLLRAPDAVVLESAAIERLVLLDTRIDAQSVVWETRGLQAVDVATLRLPRGWTNNGEEAYRVVAGRFEALASFPLKTQVRPLVTLAEIAIERPAGRRLVGRASFNLETAGADEFHLDMPPDSRLIQLSIDGIPAQSQAEGLRSWRVTTNSLRIPVEIEAIFELPQPIQASGSSLLTVLSPRLRGLAVERTIWMIADVDPSADREPGRALASNEFEAELARVETFARNLVRVSELQPGDLPRNVLIETSSRWHRRYGESRSQIDGVLRLGQQPNALFTTRLKKAEQNALEATLRLTESGVRLNDGAEILPHDSDSFLIHRDPGGTILVSQGWQEATAVRGLGPQAPQGRTWLIFPAMTALFAAAWMTFRLSAVRDRLAAQAPALLAIAGLGWWLFAPWGWLGWILAGIAIWLAVRSPWLQPGASATIGSIR